MERTLSLVLDDRGLISLTLYKADNITMDEYTIKNFESSEDVRKKYKKEIEEFLKQNENYVNAVKKATNREFRGQIVLLQVDPLDYMQLERKRVLYKKSKKDFKILCEDKYVMQEFLSLEKAGRLKGLKPIISEYNRNFIKNERNFSYPSKIEELKSSLKRENTYYEIMRLVLKAGEIIYKNRRDLRKEEEAKQEESKTREAINELNSYKEEIINGVSYREDSNSHQIGFSFVNENVPTTPNVSTNLQDEAEQRTFIVDGVVYNYEEQEQFDIDDLQNIESDLDLDGLGRNDRTFK